MNHQESLAVTSRTLSGQVLGNQYQLMEKVGQGGMAWVFQAWDIKESRAVAVKILLPHLSEDQGTVDRFLNEARIQAKLEHPSIVQTYGVMQSQQLTYTILEWVQGENLQALIHRIPPPYSISDIWRLMSPVITAVGFAHENNMVHRDLKPENFLLQWDGDTPIIKVADFGLAKILDEMEDNQTRTGMIMGTIKYMSPEQIRETKSVNHLTDIYSLGICLYLLASGDVPFRGSTQSVMSDVLLKEAPAPNTFYPEISPALNDLILRCIAKDLNERFASCQELLDAFGALVEAEGNAEDTSLVPLTSQPIPTPTLVADWKSKHDTGAYKAQQTGDMSWGGVLPTNTGQHTPSTSSKPWLWVLLVLLLGGFLGGYFLSRNSSSKQNAKSPERRAAVACHDGAKRSCYTGPKGTQGKGICKSGIQICSQGKFGLCTKQILPASSEVCNNKDDNCDGKVDEAFVNKGKSCVITLDDCKFAGLWQCHSQTKNLSCVQNEKPSDATEKRVYLRIKYPKKKNVTLKFRGKVASFTSRYCVSFSNDGPQKIRARISLRGYYSCRFRIRSSRSKELTIRLKRRGILEPRSSYCIR